MMRPVALMWLYAFPGVLSSSMAQTEYSYAYLPVISEPQIQIQLPDWTEATGRWLTKHPGKTIRNDAKS